MEAIDWFLVSMKSGLCPVYVVKVGCHQKLWMTIHNLRLQVVSWMKSVCQAMNRAPSGFEIKILPFPFSINNKTRQINQLGQTEDYFHNAKMDVDWT